MKQTLIDLVQRTIVLQCDLPSEERKLKQSHLSNKTDNCFEITDLGSLSKIIYNNIINYAYDAFEMQYDDDVLLKRALYSRIRYSDEASEEAKLGYGFYGEVLLHAVLNVIYKVPPLISKGHFFIVGNGESKGYDSYHLIEAGEHIHLWFGEAKFREQSASCIKTALDNLESKVLTDKYLTDNNFIPIFDEMHKSDAYEAQLRSSRLLNIKNKWIEKGEINIEDFKVENIGIVYPVLIAFNESRKGYDKSITNCVNYIKENYSKLVFDKISIDRTIFFIFIPMKDVKTVKNTVIQWIESKEPLM